VRVGSTLIDEPDPTDRAERREALRDMLSSMGWQSAARPAIVARAQAIERRVAAGKDMDLEDIRKMQVEYNVLRLIIDHPMEFFGNERGLE
jgi:signal recognition particle GTPase